MCNKVLSNNTSIDVKIKKCYPGAKLPFHATDGSVGYDVYAFSYEYDYEHDAHIYSTGIAIELPENVECQIRPRSSVYKVDALMTNGVGTVDCDYRGELFIIFKNRDKESIISKILTFFGLKSSFKRTPYAIGERIGQLIFNKVEKPNFIEVLELNSTKRGEGGHGSTGK